jgi:type III restriction enzyme
MKKRQILGRGVRLCVDKYGQRVEDKNINRLTVIVNESFEQFASELQTTDEISGYDSRKLNNIKKDKKKAILKKKWLDENKEFLELWDKIKNKTIFELNLNSQKYKDEVVKNLNKIETKDKKIIKQYGNMQDGYVNDEENILLNYEETLPNIINIIEKQIGISRKTIIEVFQKVNLKPFIKNSDEYIKKAIEIFEDEKHNMLIDGIEYQKINDCYKFENIFIDQYEDYNLQECTKGLYDFEQYDSDIEKKFMQCADMNFKFFTKLPTRFKIKTPFGNYSPDFAVIKYDNSEGGFVIETKGSQKERDLKGVERWKLAYAKKHFEVLDVKYKDKIDDCKDLS